MSPEEWFELIRADSIHNVDRQKLIKSVVTGIPSSLRGNIWKFLSQCYNISLNHEKNFFRELLLIKNDELECQIKKDIERTMLVEYANMSNNNRNLNNCENSHINKILKEKKQQLFNILKAYALYDPQVGYSQGTNFIVMLILSNVKSSRSAFWIFIQLMHNKNWRNMFINNTPKLIKCLDKLANHIKIKINDLYKHFENENVNNLFIYFSLSNNFLEYLLIISQPSVLIIFQWNMQIE